MGGANAEHALTHLHARDGRGSRRDAHDQMRAAHVIPEQPEAPAWPEGGDVLSEAVEEDAEAEEHLRALHRLLDGERCSATTMDDVGANRNLLPRLAWADVLVGRRFEAACRELLKSGLFPRVAPKDIFDGLSFHRLCALERQTAHEAAAQPPTLLPPAQPLPRSSEKHLRGDANVRERRACASASP